MRRKLFSIISLWLAGIAVFAQENQWASEVLDYSSELSAYEYAAQQALGKPNVLPNAGDNPNAWLPRRNDRVEYIKVGFKTPMRVQQIAIAESFNPGAVTEVYLYDLAGREYLINTFIARPLSVKGRMLNIYIDETEYEAKAAKVVIDGSQVPGYNGIDAIGISGTKIPLIATQEIAIISNPTLSGNEVSLNATGEVSDTRPVYVKKFNTLFFTRGFHPNNLGTAEDPGDIWQTTVTPRGTMGEVGPLGETINNYGLSTTGGYYNLDGKDLFLFGNVTGNPGQSRQNVVLVEKNGEQWTDIREQNIRSGNIVSFNADYALASRGKVMFISTLRYDTEGGRDIYISYLDGKNKWTEPMNLGRKINTAMDEFSPFYAESEGALYFSTEGFAGFGKGDIYRVVRLDSTWNNWSDAVNLGPDINSSYDEKYYYFDEQDDYVYFARNDDDSVYHIIRTDRPEILESTPLVVVQGNVVSMKTTEPLSSEITFNLLPGGRQLASTTSDAGSGGYEVLIPSGYEYKVSVNENGYEPYDKTLFLENRGQQYIYEYDIPLSGVTLVAEKEEKKAPVKLTTPEEILASGIVLFEFNSYIPKDDESFEMIYRVVDFMKKNPEYKLDIYGYADPIGRDSYNKKLSKERADRVKKEMVEEGGINPRRISTHGMGSVKTGAPTRDEQTLAIMRKVEFKFTR